MPFQVSPSITVTEKDLTTIVPSVATTIAGFAGSFSWGPADEIVTVDSPKNYRNLFGDPYNWNAEEWFTGANFLDYGRNLLVVRKTSDSAKNAGMTAAAVTEYVPNDGKNITSLNPSVIARFPGELGNSLNVHIGGNSVNSDSGWDYWSYFRRSPNSSDNLINLAGATTYDQVHVVVVDEGGLFTGNPGEVLEKYESVSLHPLGKNLNGSSSFWKNVINERSRYIRVSGSEDIYDLGTTASGFCQDVDLGVVDGADVDSGQHVFTWSESQIFTTPTKTKFNGGIGQELNGASKVTQGLGSGQGYDLFSDTENVDVNLVLGANIHEIPNVGYLKNLVENRKDCVLFLSSPVTKNDLYITDSEKADKCVNFVNNTVGSSSYVVVDSGYKRHFDPYNQTFRWIPLNADIAGLCARTDLTNDPWFSPAGLNRGQIRNTIKLAFNPNKTFRDIIYPKGINPIISVPGEGTILFGDRTALSKPSAFDRINVRRLFIVLEKAIAAASKFSLFEINDAFTRQQFRSLVEPFLRDVKARRGIFDFKVVCDETNNTPEMIDRNEFAADIYIKPTRTINFIQLNFVATRTGVSFDEVGA